MEKDFKITPVNRKPSKHYEKVSKYDRIINKFLLEQINIAQIEISKNADYIREQLKRRIKNRNLSEKIKVSVVNNKVYIEKI